MDTHKAERPDEGADTSPEASVIPIAKPTSTSLDRFKSRPPATIGGVETLVEALPHYRISQAKDYVRLHPNEEDYWSSDLCFVRVPIIGTSKDTLHLIADDLARAYLPS